MSKLCASQRDESCGNDVRCDGGTTTTQTPRSVRTRTRRRRSTFHHGEHKESLSGGGANHRRTARTRSEGRPKHDDGQCASGTRREYVIYAFQGIIYHKLFTHALFAKDADELEDFKALKRKTFEKRLSNNRYNIGNYVNYAKFEEKLGEFRRARSVFERALLVEPTNADLFAQYVDFEVRNKFLNRARNVLDAALTVLPSRAKLWLKYVRLEESAGSAEHTREVFERWMQTAPADGAWRAYVDFEVRFGQDLLRAKDVFERWCGLSPSVTAYVKYARFEYKYRKEIAEARDIFERALGVGGRQAELDLNALPPQDLATLWSEFALFEQEQGEIERARAVFTYALDAERPGAVPEEYSHELRTSYSSFERTKGKASDVDDAVVERRRETYERRVVDSPTNCDAWFDLLRLEEAQPLQDAQDDPQDLEQVERTRAAYKRAGASTPTIRTKDAWRRYVHVWLRWALYEELVQRDRDRARAVMAAALDVVPHKQFTFSKLWLHAAELELRDGQLGTARRLLGSALGKCPTTKLHREYLQLELRLGDVDRVRILYSKWLEHDSTSGRVWRKFAELESAIREVERARGIYALGRQSATSGVRELFASNVKFETTNGDEERLSDLFRSELESRVEAWSEYVCALYALGRVDAARKACAQGQDALKARQTSTADDEEKTKCKSARRLLLVESISCEENAAEKARLTALLPAVVTKKRKVIDDDGNDRGWEEYQDFVFGDDERAATGLKLLETAKRFAEAKRKASALAESKAKRTKVDDANEIDLEDDETSSSDDSSDDSSEDDDDEE